MTIKVRNCPSPTGKLHIGTLRTALYNYLFAKANGGEILFRSEDTDKQRSTKEYEQDIYNGLIKIGLIADNTPIIRQSERTEIYKQYIEQLLNEGKAYYCFMTTEELEQERETQKAQKLPPRYSGKYRGYPLAEAQQRITNGEKAVIRFQIPDNQDIHFTDLIRGNNTINSKELGGDFVIAKDLNTPLYNFVVVIDDHLMGITHVLRGEDHIANTPKQILISQSLGFDLPQFAHLPLILNSDKSKLSKRKNKVSVNDYLAEGYLPEAIINFLALLGWNPKDTQEIFTIEQLEQKFSLEGVNKSGAIFDIKKLEFINNHFIKNFSNQQFIDRIQPFLGEQLTQLQTENPAIYEKILIIQKDRLHRMTEVNEKLEWYFNPKELDPQLFPHKKMKVTLETALDSLTTMIPFLETISEENWNQDTIKEQFITEVKRLGGKNGYYLWPLRVALSKEAFSPSPFEIMEIFGKTRSLQNIIQAKEILEKK